MEVILNGCADYRGMDQIDRNRDDRDNGDNGDNWDRAKARILRSYPPPSWGDFPSLYYLLLFVRTVGGSNVVFEPKAEKRAGSEAAH